MTAHPQQGLIAMATVDATSVQERGQDLIMVPVNANFNRLTREGRVAFFNDATESAKGMDGAVCVVWEGGSLDMYLGPPNLREFYERISFEFAFKNTNGKIPLEQPGWFHGVF